MSFDDMIPLYFSDIFNEIKRLIVSITDISWSDFTLTDNVLVFLLAFVLGIFILYKCIQFIWGLFRL